MSPIFKALLKLLYHQKPFKIWLWWNIL